MAAVALVVHPDRPRAAELAREIAEWLTARGDDVRLTRDDAAAAGLGELGRDDADVVDGLDVVVSLGGDGTMLRAVALVATADVPVIGVNVGQLAYLSEVEPSGAFRLICRQRQTAAVRQAHHADAHACIRFGRSARRTHSAAAALRPSCSAARSMSLRATSSLLSGGHASLISAVMRCTAFASPPNTPRATPVRLRC